MSSSFEIAYEKINTIYLSSNDIKKTQESISNLEIGNRTKNWLSRFFDLRESKIIKLDNPNKILSKSDIRNVITTNIDILKNAHSTDEKAIHPKDTSKKKNYESFENTNQ